MATPLSSITKLRQYLKIPDRDEDPVLEQHLLSASSDVETETGRLMLLGDRSEVRNGNGQRSIFLRQYPIVSVTSLLIEGEPVSARSSANPDGYVIADAEAGELAIPAGGFPRGVANVEIVYRAGYESIPPDLEQAVLELAALRYVDRDHPGVSYKVMEGQVTDFRGGSQLAYAKAVIDRYRRPPDPG